MKRRNFIKMAGASASLPFLMRGIPVYAKEDKILDEIASGGDADDRILVLIQLNGGNDGLNTVVPLDQLSELNAVREQVILPENSLLKISDEQALHPALTGFKELWDEEKLEIVQNVGYENQNLSHFRSTDIWTSASDADEYIGSGWLGRYLSENHPGYPDGYPNTENSDPLSLTVGSLVSQTCQGPVFSMGLAVRNLDDFYSLNINGNSNNVDGYAAPELEYVNTVIRQTQSYLDVLETAAEKGSINNSLWQNEGVNSLADQLKVVATLINGGLKTKIYVCMISGFDTHGSQVNPDDHTEGIHANLLQNVGDAVNSFQKQLKEYGIEDKVLGMTFSEFGRRIIANNSNGTDHGYSAPHFFFGSKVNPVVHGNNPIIPYDAGPKDNLEEEYDFRSLYWSVLKDWFRVSDEKLLKILFKDFPHIEILKPNPTSVENVEDYQYSAKILKVYPNPATSFSEVELYTTNDYVEISILDISGREVKSIFSGQLHKGRHQIRINNLNLPPGNYFIKLRNSKAIDTYKLSIVR